MKKLNKLFAKKHKEVEAEPHYTATSSAALSSMSSQELCGIIFKYDDEVKRLNGLTEGLLKDKEEGERVREEGKLYKAQAEVGCM